MPPSLPGLLRPDTEGPFPTSPQGDLMREVTVPASRMKKLRLSGGVLACPESQPGARTRAPGQKAPRGKDLCAHVGTCPFQQPGARAEGTLRTPNPGQRINFAQTQGHRGELLPRVKPDVPGDINDPNGGPSPKTTGPEATTTSESSQLKTASDPGLDPGAGENDVCFFTRTTLPGQA